MVNHSPLPLATALLAALGSGYTQTQSPHRRHDDPPSPHLRIRTPEGAEFTVYATGYGHPKHFRIAGDYPTSRRHGTFYPSAAPVIQVSILKTGEKIAKDVQRRFLPDFLAAWDEARTRAQAAEDAHAAKVKTYRDLCEILGETPKEPEFFHNSEFLIYHHLPDSGSLTVRVQTAESIRIEVSTERTGGVELAKAIKMLYARTNHTEPNQASAA